MALSALRHQPEDRLQAVGAVATDLSRALLYFLYGGRSSYDHLNRIKRLIIESRADSPQPALVMEQGSGEVGGAHTTEGVANGAVAAQHEAAGRDIVRDLLLPQWANFVELVRQTLDSPLDVTRAPLLLREIGWTALAGGIMAKDGVTSFARVLAGSSPQGARFAVLALDYLSRAARLPREFREVITGRLLAAQTK